MIHNVSSSGELVGKLCICIQDHNCHKQTLLCLYCLGLSLEPICLEQSLGDSLRLSFENFPPGLKTLRGKMIIADSMHLSSILEKEKVV